MKRGVGILSALVSLLERISQAGSIRHIRDDTCAARGYRSATATGRSNPIAVDVPLTQTLH